MRRYHLAHKEVVERQKGRGRHRVGERTEECLLGADRGGVVGCARREAGQRAVQPLEPLVDAKHRRQRLAQLLSGAAEMDELRCTQAGRVKRQVGSAARSLPLAEFARLEQLRREFGLRDGGSHLRRELEVVVRP